MKSPEASHALDQYKGETMHNKIQDLAFFVVESVLLGLLISEVVAKPSAIGGATIALLALHLKISIDNLTEPE